MPRVYSRRKEIFPVVTKLKSNCRVIVIMIIIINIIIIIIIVISFMQGIYTYIPETNHVPREYSVAAILSLLYRV